MMEYIEQNDVGEDVRVTVTPGGSVIRELVRPAIPEKEDRRVSVGAFFDRFGPAKWGILADTSPSVQAVIKDASVREFIDLDNADLPAGLAIVQAAGHAIDPQAIIGAEIEPQERP